MNSETNLLREEFLDERIHQLPSITESAEWIIKLGKPTVCQILDKAKNPVLQPRSGVADHALMLEYIRAFDDSAAGILTLTIDSYTRLLQLDQLAEAMKSRPSEINGYPLVYHGWEKGREINRSASKPIQIRHGSPDPRLLFEHSIAAGFSSFEGGGITYNLPYCKNVSISRSLSDWRYVDSICGELFQAGVIIDREIFGTLTAVLSPPSLSIAISILEAFLAQDSGVRCISISLTQCGSFNQDIAALQVLRKFMAQYLNTPYQFVVLHQYMGPFPSNPAKALALLLKGSLIGRLGCADKIVTKTAREAICLPDLSSNLTGLDVSSISQLLDLSISEFDASAVDVEAELIWNEVSAILSFFSFDQSLPAQIVEAFKAGTLDYPFCTNSSVKSDVMCLRDDSGAIRIVHPGNVPIPTDIIHENISSTRFKNMSSADVFKKQSEAIYHFL